MSTPNDSTTVLNPGAGGDTMDESAPARVDGTVRKRARVVLAGDGNESAVVDLLFVGGKWILPVSDPETVALLNRLITLHTRTNQLLARLAGVPF